MKLRRTEQTNRTKTLQLIHQLFLQGSWAETKIDAWTFFNRRWLAKEFMHEFERTCASRSDEVALQHLLMCFNTHQLFLCSRSCKNSAAGAHIIGVSTFLCPRQFGGSSAETTSSSAVGEKNNSETEAGPPPAHRHELVGTMDEWDHKPLRARKLKLFTTDNRRLQISKIYHTFFKIWSKPQLLFQNLV